MFMGGILYGRSQERREILKKVFKAFEENG